MLKTQICVTCPQCVKAYLSKTFLKLSCNISVVIDILNAESTQYLWLPPLHCSPLRHYRTTCNGVILEKLTIAQLVKKFPSLMEPENTGLFISPSGISELDCATTKTGTAERNISIGRESLQVFFLYWGPWCISRFHR